MMKAENVDSTSTPDNVKAHEISLTKSPMMTEKQKRASALTKLADSMQMANDVLREMNEYGDDIDIHIEGDFGEYDNTLMKSIPKERLANRDKGGQLALQNLRDGASLATEELIHSDYAGRHEDARQLID